VPLDIFPVIPPLLVVIFNAECKRLEYIQNMIRAELDEIVGQKETGNKFDYVCWKIREDNVISFHFLWLRLLLRCFGLLWFALLGGLLYTFTQKVIQFFSNRD
jgi:hypothetical protein